MKKGVYAIAIGSLLAIGACKKKETIYQFYTVPTTYNFDNVDYAEATKAVNMWQGFQAYLGRSTGRQLSQDTVNYLWNNTNNAFTAENVSNLPNSPANLNAATTIKLSALTTEPNVIKAFADSMVVISQYYNTAGGTGVAGKQGSRLFNYSGLEFNQAVAKGLMGGFAMKKIFEHLDNSTTADNNTITPGIGTAMQHQWDLAFGYVCIPKADYVNRNADTLLAISNTNPNRPLAIGGYFAERGKYIKAGQKVYDAFIKGRAAIDAKDYATRDAAIATIKEYIEKTLAAAAWNYVVQPRSGSDQPARLHQLSEGYGFAIALKHRPANSTLTAANYQNFMTIMNTNFYTLLAEPGNAKLVDAKNILKAAYGMLQATE